MLVIDDSTLDKPHARKIPLVARHWSGKHHDVVRGINLITLLWTDGDRKLPCDYRVFNKADGKTKHDHFWEMLLMAKGRGFSPIRPVRWLVRQPGESQAGPRPRLALADPPEGQPSGDARGPDQADAG